MGANAGAGLTQSNAWLKAIFAQTTGGIALTDLDGSFVTVNQRYCEIVGYSEPELLKMRMQDITHPEDLPGNLVQFHRMVETGSSFDIEKRYIRRDGTLVWVSNSVSVIRSDSGKITQAVTVTIDVTERKRAQEEVRQLAAIIASSDDAIISIDLGMNIRSWNRGAEKLYGYSAEEAIGSPATIILPTDIVDEENIIIDSIKAGGHVQPHETRRRHKNGTEVHVSLRVSPVYDENGYVVGASKIARDISERKEAERLQNLLVGELTHRVKNVLATVNAVVRQTLGPVVPDSQEAVLQARLEALARAYDLLTISNWENASLHDIVRKAMSPYREDSVQIEGDPVCVSARAVLPLSLILHELGTNAAKYGALSVDGGQVFLRWSVANSSETAKPVLKLLWEERGGPAVTVPSRQGFGSRLIKAVTTSELGGCVVADYAHTGFVCDFEIALSSLTLNHGFGPAKGSPIVDVCQ
ncbi:PAS domain S-box protein [Rhizobium changzhiense]|uniref:PAS domain-containing sensor histidine kinase n=1 Tax=Rhizobium changzhiense TaxID=2692317 RepID=UPI001F0B9F25|nr:PAS domain S-box protein [Rhizobium changzhiense]MCH4547435.1 PAS domain S-box protein [Rhizobium changzhiense]